jgi:predicted Zn-dependent protease
MYSPRSRVTSVALAAFSVLVSFCSGCMGPAPSGQFVQQAQRLHDAALVSAVTQDTDLREYVQMVGRRVGDAAHQVDPNRTHDSLYAAMEYHLANCAVPNVFTTGGVHLYVYNGLFQACRTEDELAAVIAHAYAHEMNLDLEHLEMRPDPAMPPRLVVWQFVTHRFTLTQEQAADRLAFDILVKAGYDPNAPAMLFEHLGDAFPTLQAPDRTPIILRSQQARQWARSEKSAERRPLPVADPKTFESLRRQAASMKTNVNSEAQLFLRAFPNCLLSGDTPDQQAAQEQLRPPTPAKRLEPS